METRHFKGKLYLSVLTFLVLLNFTLAESRSHIPARVLAKQTGATQYEEEQYESHADCNDHKHHLKKRASDEDVDYEVYQGVVGRPGIDFPIYPRIPKTSFSCRSYGNGYFADMETDCQVFHICEEGRKISFLCPNGTIFQQSELTCDWWFKVNCLGSSGFYADSTELLNKQRVQRLKPSIPVQGFNIVGGGLNIKPRVPASKTQSRSRGGATNVAGSSKTDRRIDSSEAPSLESVDFDDLSGEKQIKGVNKPEISTIDSNDNDEVQIPAESASFVTSRSRNGYSHDKPKTEHKVEQAPKSGSSKSADDGSKRGAGDRGSQRHGYGGLLNAEPTEKTRQGQRGNQRYREDKKTEVKDKQRTTSDERPLKKDKLVENLDKLSHPTPSYVSGTYTTARRLDSTRTTPFYTPTVPSVVKGKSTEGKSNYGSSKGGSPTTPTPHRFGVSNNKPGIFLDGNGALKPTVSTQDYEITAPTTVRPIIIGMRRYNDGGKDYSSESQGAGGRSNANLEFSLPSNHKNYDSGEFTTTPAPTTGPTYLPKSASKPKSIHGAGGDDALLFAPITVPQDDDVSRNVNDMLKTINVLQHNFDDVELVKVNGNGNGYDGNSNGNGRFGLDIPASSGPDALFSLAKYFATEDTNSLNKNVNSLEDGSGGKKSGSSSRNSNAGDNNRSGGNGGGGSSKSSTAGGTKFSQGNDLNSSKNGSSTGSPLTTSHSRGSGNGKPSQGGSGSGGNGFGGKGPIGNGSGGSGFGGKGPIGNGSSKSSATGSAANLPSKAPKEKPSDTTATLTTVAPATLARNADHISSSLLSNSTVRRYNTLFGLEGSKDSDSEASRGLGLADINAPTTKDINTPFPQIGATDATIRGLAGNPESRQIAQVFSNAINNYLNDPVKFRDELVSVRPTEPPADKSFNFVAVTDPTLFNQGTAATYLPTAAPPTRHSLSTTHPNIASVINTNLITSTGYPDYSSTTEVFDSTTFRQGSGEQRHSLEFSGELEPPGADSGEELLQREHTQSFVNSRNGLLRSSEKSGKLDFAKPEKPWSFAEDDAILDPLKINDGLMKKHQPSRSTTTTSPINLLIGEVTTIVPKSQAEGHSSSGARGHNRHLSDKYTTHDDDDYSRGNGRLQGELKPSDKYRSGSDDPWADIFDSYDLPKESLPTNSGLQRIANKLFGGLNENEASHLKNVMAEAEHNRQILRLLLLLIQTCDDNNGKALERSRKSLLNALISMDSKVTTKANGKNKQFTTTEKLPVTTYRRTGSGEEITTSTFGYPSTTTDVPSTTLYGSTTTDAANSGETTKFAIIVDDDVGSTTSTTTTTNSKASATGSAGSGSQLDGNSDKRALELLKSLYSLASKFTSRR